MYALDFQYDGRYLSDYGFMICTLGYGSDFETRTAGSRITFNKVSRHRGKIYSLVGTQYDECITAVFDICKNTDNNEDENMYITTDEYRSLMRWLNRNEFLHFRLLGTEEEDMDTCTFNASFNVDKVMVNRQLAALELTLETDKPFGYGRERKYVWTVTNTGTPCVLEDRSDEIGYIYPNMKITCNSGGNLSIHNDLENCTMTVNNCASGEVLTVDGSAQIIESSVKSHKVYDDFNFEFLRIGNTMKNNHNKITVSLPCKLEISYCPIIKDSPA